ncbi:hypothetical protein EIZ47_07370 [Chryseobacterium lacus]|uniref:Uncharacterized protein n=1 Tax=Chryseobacterium lacus TaxID=2058346 RepID=A0A368MXS8_9FLAO|nr:hypothetical protein [Chryseobacterium lacus]RCU42653.1 hypothetical protein DQ356_07455 [Chryseobacterium lacus]RST27209.1 hypothetical protein EIZ47_07370 [Chryseobacterium lacus]
MFVPQQLRRDFEKNRNKTSNPEVYHKILKSDFEDYGGFCELYVEAQNGIIETEQVVILNDFMEKYQHFIPEIRQFINLNLKPFEKLIKPIIDKAAFTIDVIDIPKNHSQYDVVMICGKTYRFLFWKKEIAIRVEFQDGRIQSMKRTDNPALEN